MYCTYIVIGTDRSTDRVLIETYYIVTEQLLPLVCRGERPPCRLRRPLPSRSADPRDRRARRRSSAAPGCFCRFHRVPSTSRPRRVLFSTYPRAPRGGRRTGDGEDGRKRRFATPIIGRFGPPPQYLYTDVYIRAYADGRHRGNTESRGRGIYFH